MDSFRPLNDFAFRSRSVALRWAALHSNGFGVRVS